MKKNGRAGRIIGGLVTVLVAGTGVLQAYASLNSDGAVNYINEVEVESEQTNESAGTDEATQTTVIHDTKQPLGPAAYLDGTLEGVSDTEETVAETETEAEPQEREVAEEEIDAYFSDSVFVGDSVMLGFRNYSMRRQDTFLANMKFLAAGSLSAHNAFWEISSKSVHPIYQGEKRMIWDSISMMQAKKVFLFFGLNDLNIGGVDGSCAKYKELADKILEQSPDAKIHIISMTYTLAGKGKGHLNNNEIRQFNDKMKQIAQENGWGYVDLATALADANGDLAPQYCSDQYVHQTTAAYDVWVSVLREYARNELKWEPAPVQEGQ